MTGPQFWLVFGLGFVAGGSLATLLVALLVAAGDADRALEQESPTCPACGGSGCRVDEEGGCCLAAHPDDGQDHGPCSTCNGAGFLARVPA